MRGADSKAGNQTNQQLLKRVAKNNKNEKTVTRSENSSAKQEVQLRSHFFFVEAPRRTSVSSLEFASFLVTRRSVCQSHQFRHVFFLLLFRFRQLIKPLSCHVAAAHGLAELISPQQEEDMPNEVLSVHSAPVRRVRRC